MMYDLTGYMVINGKDAWTEYSAFLCEDRPEDSTNVTELLKPPEMKEYTAVDFRERNGEELPQQLPLPRCKPRDLTLYLAVYAPSLSGCEARRLALMQGNPPGKRDIHRIQALLQVRHTGRYPDRCF